MYRLAPAPLVPNRVTFAVYSTRSANVTNGLYPMICPLALGACLDRDHQAARRWHQRRTPDRARPDRLDQAAAGPPLAGRSAASARACRLRPDRNARRLGSHDQPGSVINHRSGQRSCCTIVVVPHLPGRQAQDAAQREAEAVRTDCGQSAVRPRIPCFQSRSYRHRRCSMGA